MIHFKNVSKAFDTPQGPIEILNDTSIQVKSGAFIALMGPSGIGKTTFLNMMSGLEKQDSGDIIVNETNIASLTPDEVTRWRGKHISFVFQQFNLLPQLNVTENIDLVIELNNLERRYTTEEILSKVGLANRGKAYPGTLSGGEQQRVAIARAFVGKTPILLADEPTGNLDQKTAKIIMQLMSSLHTEVNNTILMITHDRKTADYANELYYFENQGLEVAVS